MRKGAKLIKALYFLFLVLDLYILFLVKNYKKLFTFFIINDIKFVYGNSYFDIFGGMYRGVI